MSPNQNQDSPFPILVIAAISMAVTAFLLLSYYIFIVNRCSGLHQLGRLSPWRPPRPEEDDPFIAISPRTWNHGLERSAIREIPASQYTRRGGVVEWCVICMNEFRERDTLRALPRCGHRFHLDCIDVWLEGNSNCPLCRSGISGMRGQCPSDQIVAPSSSPQGSGPYTESLMGGDEDFVVIELGGGSREAAPDRETCQSPRKLDGKLGKLKPGKMHHVSVMGDECIDMRKKDDQFYIQPIRRSFSLDSAKSQLLYLTVQTVIQHNVQQEFQRSSHSLRFGQGSRNAVFPI